MSDIFDTITLEKSKRDIFDTITQRGGNLRADGTEKGLGFFGELKRPDGRISTELSIGVGFDGKETEIPSLVPTLTQSEIDSLLAGGEITEAIKNKAVEHARGRTRVGQSPFAGPGEQKPREQDIFDEIAPTQPRERLTQESLQGLSVEEILALERPLVEEAGQFLRSIGAIEPPDVVAKRKAEELAAKRLEVSERPTTALAEAEKSLERGRLNVQSGLGGTLAEFAKFAETKAGVSKPVLSKIGSVADSIARSARIDLKAPELTPATLKGKKPLEKAGLFVAQVVPETLSFMAGVTVATVIGGPVAGGAVAFSVEGESAFQEALDRGATREEANIDRMIVGTINAAIEQYQAQGVLKFGKKGFESLRKLATKKTFAALKEAGKEVSLAGLKQFITEGLQESTQELVGIATPAVRMGEMPDIDKALKQIGTAGLAGGVSGLVLGGGASLAQLGLDGTAKPPAAEPTAPAQPPVAKPPVEAKVVPPKPPTAKIEPQAVEGEETPAMKKANKVLNKLDPKQEYSFQVDPLGRSLPMTVEQFKKSSYAKDLKELISVDIGGRLAKGGTKAVWDREGWIAPPVTKPKGRPDKKTVIESEEEIKAAIAAKKRAKLKIAEPVEDAKSVKQALLKGEKVPLETLEKYKNQQWAENAIDNLYHKKQASSPGTEVKKAVSKKPVSVKRAGQLRKMADTTDKHIEDKRREMTSNPTPKRMREYRSRLHDADNLERAQRAMRAMADAIEKGELPKELENIRTKSDIQQLVVKGLLGGGYYDVIPSPDYHNTTPAGKALQNLIEAKESPEEEAERVKREAKRELEEAVEKVRFTKIQGFFPTPKPLAQRLIDDADLSAGQKVLEPSAGKGDIADLIKEEGIDPHVIEIVPSLQEILKLKEHNIVDTDFLEHTGKYDRIVMNPPFEKGQDIDHVRHAYELLKPGGRIVSIMSEGPFFRSDKKATEFREWLDDKGTSEKFDAGSFKGKEAFRQTGVSGRIIVIDKPVEQKGFTADPTVPTKATGEPAFAGIDRPGGKTTKPWLDTKKVNSPDEDIESFFGRTKRSPYSRKASKLMTAIKAGLRERFVTMTPHIESTPETAIYRDMIRTLPEEVRQAGQKAVRDIVSVLDNDGTVRALDSVGLDLLRRKVFIQDILHEAEISRSVSGNLDRDALAKEDKRLDELIEKVPSVKRAYESRQKLWEEVSQDLLERGVLDEETAKNKHYVRHFVLDLAEKNGPTGFSRKKLSAPYRAYRKKRKGSVRDISTDYLEVEVRALSQIYKDNAIEDVANKISEFADKRKEYTAAARKENIKNAGQPPADLKGFAVDSWLKEKLGGKFVTPEKLGEKDGYTEWHYKRPNLFYRAHTLVESQIAALVESSAEEAGSILKIPKEKMREALVLGRRKGMIIPDWLAKQLDDLPVNRRSNYVVRSFTKPFVQFWKRWILRVNPFRYNARNQIGDTERLIASGQESSIKDIPAAVKLLVTKEGEVYDLMKKYGVAGSTLWHEMNDVSTIKEFEKFKDYSKPKTLKRITKKAFLLPIQTASKVGSVEQNLTQFREDILRAAVFINNYNKLQKGKPVKHWAGSIAEIEEIAKTDKPRAAAKISRETLGDYGAFTPFETDVLRQGIIPFYSWMKINTVFWPRVLKNAAKDGTVGKPLAAGATLVGVNLTKWLVRVLWAYAAAYLWNNRNREASKKENALAFWLRAMPHINIGKYTLWGQTALSDFVEWVDMQELASVNWRREAGFMDNKEAALEAARVIAQSPVNKIYQSFNPFMKAPITAISGQETWPSVFDPHFVASPASKKSFERAVIGILGSDAKKFYQSAKGDRKFEDTLYAYFSGWWMRPTDPDVLIEEIKRSKEWSSLKRKSKTTGRKAGEAKKGKEKQWQEAEIRSGEQKTDLTKARVRK